LPRGGDAITLDAINAERYYFWVIVSYRDSDTEALGSGRRVRRFVAFESVARRKLRINDQFRVCFTWTPAGPDDVEIVDYH